jgi:ABC-type branched-subunit amino acid transport system ATPase component
VLTRLRVRNFKRLRDESIELGRAVVFIGPNNSGKTTALQALSLWELGLRRWNEKRGTSEAPKERLGVTINRRDLSAVPVPDASYLWRDLHMQQGGINESGGRVTHKIRIEIVVEGVTAGTAWECGFEFEYANEESLYCRPLRLSDERRPDRMPVPDEASPVRVAFLPPMSGLADREFAKQPGEIAFLVGQGRTAEVMRNLCHHLANVDPAAWDRVTARMADLFGVQLDSPRYIAERAEIEMTYVERSGVALDLSSAGRGLQQTLLLLAYLESNPGSVLLLDEPDAHLEILRQRHIYQLLTEAARGADTQIVAASHSEVLLNEAADRDVVVAFVGRPHRIDDRGTQVVKALKEIGFEHYVQAEETGWVLYLEGSTDLAILRAFAEILDHPAVECLRMPFVHYVANQPQAARQHFFGLREAKPDLAGIAIFDRLERGVAEGSALVERMWQGREIENYLCSRDVLEAWTASESRASGPASGPLFESSTKVAWAKAMAESIDEIETALTTLRRPSPWSMDIKATDDFLDTLFAKFFDRVGLPNLMRKTDYHVLARFVPAARLDGEVRECLDAIVAVARAGASGVAVPDSNR